MRGKLFRSRIRERTISLRFPGIILGVLRLEVSLYNVGRGDYEYQGGKLFCLNYVQEFGLSSLPSFYCVLRVYLHTQKRNPVSYIIHSESFKKQNKKHETHSLFVSVKSYSFESGKFS
jgi:hypothetical protein